MLTEVVANRDEPAFTIRPNSECNKRSLVAVCYHKGGMVLNVGIGGIMLNAEAVPGNLCMCM